MIFRIFLVLFSGLLLGLSLGVPARAESQFILLDEPVLTLRTPAGATQQRLEALEQRFQDIIENTNPPLQITVQGDEVQAQIRLNDQFLLEVTVADAEANSTTQVKALADLWADRLRAVLGTSSAQQRLFRTAGLPEQIRFQSKTYRRQPEPVTDLGRFFTDGTRIDDQVIFWEIDPNQKDRALTSAPIAIYVLNAGRQFVAYRSL